VRQVSDGRTGDERWDCTGVEAGKGRSEARKAVHQTERYRYAADDKQRKRDMKETHDKQRKRDMRERKVT
jgi:hypothetical protein